MQVGTLQKIVTSLKLQQAQYHLQLGQDAIYLNAYVGKKITLRHTGQINCIACNTAIKKSYQQGYFRISKHLIQQFFISRLNHIKKRTAIFRFFCVGGV